MSRPLQSGPSGLRSQGNAVWRPCVTTVHLPFRERITPVRGAECRILPTAGEVQRTHVPTPVPRSRCSQTSFACSAAAILPGCHVLAAGGGARSTPGSASDSLVFTRCEARMCQCRLSDGSAVSPIIPPFADVRWRLWRRWRLAAVPPLALVMIHLPADFSPWRELRLNGHHGEFGWQTACESALSSSGDDRTNVNSPFNSCSPCPSFDRLV
jgi:hypothetical protein